MGKIIALCDFDQTSEEIWRLALHTREIVGKEKPNFLLVPTSAFDLYNKNTLNVYHKAGCNVDKLLLTEPYITEELVAEKLRRADMINVPGGNLKFLMETWEKTKAADYIREAYDRGALVFGSSAGSMCWFGEGWDNCGLYDGKMYVDAMGFKPYTVCPHYEHESWQSFDDHVKDARYDGIAVEDGSALCLIDGHNYILKAKGNETCWYFSKTDGKKYDLSEHPEILKKL